MQITKKEYDRITAALPEIMKIQAMKNPPGALILPDVNKNIFTVKDWEDHYIDKYFPLYLDVALLYTLTDENGEYIFQPEIVSASEEKNLEDVRAFLKEALERNLQIV